MRRRHEDLTDFSPPSDDRFNSIARFSDLAANTFTVSVSDGRLTDNGDRIIDLHQIQPREVRQRQDLNRYNSLYF